MLPSNQRLTRQQFTDFLKNPEIKVVFNPLGTFKYIKKESGLRNGKPDSFSDLSVVTGSKYQKKAVLRNKMRRRLYTIFHKNPYNISISGVFYVSKQSYELSYEQLKDYFYALLSKIEKNTTSNS
jgi:ribonuclease P protein component